MAGTARNDPSDTGASARRPVWRQTFTALQHRNFRFLWFSTVFTSGGNWIQQVTVGWLAFELSNSAFHVGAIMGLRALPLLMAPIAGVLADRFDRRKILLVDQAFLAVLAVGFSVVVLMDQHVLWHLYLFSFLTGVAWSMNNPVRQALVANSVPREHLMNAVALNSMAFNFTRVLGPAVGGGLIVFSGPGVNFLIQGLFYVGVMLMVLPFRPMYPTDYRVARQRSIMTNLLDGFRYVRSDRTVITVILVALVPTLTMMSFTQTLMPVYTVRVLGDTGGGVLGLMLSVMGLGGFIGTLLIATFSQVRRKGLLVTVALLTAGVSIVAFSQVSSLWAAIPLLMIMNAALMANMTTNNTILQSIIPDEMRGRVMGVYMMDIGMMPLGGMVGGILADQFSVQTALLSGSLVGLTVILLLTLLNPRFRRIVV